MDSSYLVSTVSCLMHKVQGIARTSRVYSLLQQSKTHTQINKDANQIAQLPAGTWLRWANNQAAGDSANNCAAVINHYTMVNLMPEGGHKLLPAVCDG